MASHHRLWLRHAETRDLLRGGGANTVGSKSRPKELVLGQTWARGAFRELDGGVGVQGREALSKRRPRKVGLVNPSVGDVVESIDECSQALERSLEVERKLLSDKLDTVSRKLEGGWEAQSDVFDLCRDRADLRERLTVTTRRLARVKGARTGRGVVAPSAGKAIAPDGGIRVRWDDGETHTYYRTGPRAAYPLSLAYPRAKSRAGGAGAGAGGVMQKRPATSQGGAREGWTLMLGLNAMIVPGEKEMRERKKKKAELMKRFMRVWLNTKMSKAFHKWATYQRPRKFCLLTMNPLGLEAEDTPQQFYEPLIGGLIFRPPRARKHQEQWQMSVLDNASNKEWYELKKQEQEANEGGVGSRLSVVDSILKGKGGEVGARDSIFDLDALDALDALGGDEYHPSQLLSSDLLPEHPIDQDLDLDLADRDMASSARAREAGSLLADATNHETNVGIGAPSRQSIPGKDSNASGGEAAMARPWTSQQSSSSLSGSPLRSATARIGLGSAVRDSPLGSIKDSSTSVRMQGRAEVVPVKRSVTVDLANK